MDGKNQNKINKEQVLEFIRTPKGKAVLFFGIYFVFFIVLAMIAHIGGQGPVLGSTDLKLGDFSYDLSSIKEGNYNFSYQFSIDQLNTTYSGKHYEENSLFSDGTISYYQQGNLFMRNQNGVWIKSEAPYPLVSLTDVSTIDSLISSSTYVSKTELATGEEIINLQITSTTLVKILDGLEVDLDDPVNSIQLKKNENGEVVEIQYTLDSYAKYKRRRAYHNLPFIDHIYDNLDNYNNSVFDNNQDNRAFNCDAFKMIDNLSEIVDIIYMDPPYPATMNKYGDFYGLYDNIFDKKIKYTNFSENNRFLDNLEKLIIKCLPKTKYVVISENNKTKPTISEISTMLSKYGKVEIKEKKHQYKVTNKENKNETIEVLIILEVKENK